MGQPIKKSQNLKPIPFPNSIPSKPLSFISISITILLVISLPILYISLLHIPPSNLLKDTTFWFLLSNSIIIIVATDSGAFSSNPNIDTNSEIYDEFMLHNRTTKQSVIAIVPMKNPLALSCKVEKIEERRKTVMVKEGVKEEDIVCLREKNEPFEDSMMLQSKETSEEGCDYWSMSDEELNRRVEEFIKLNKENMLQEARK